MKTHVIGLRGRAGRYARRVAGLSRWRSRPRVLIAAAAGIILATGVFAAPAAASASTPSITLQPTSGPPATKVSVSGAGFGASETVVVDFGATQVATAATSPTGTFTAAFTVPTTAPRGSDPVTATGQTSHLSATAYFLIRTNWAMFGFNAANTRDNPYENVLSPTKVTTGLKEAWQVRSSVFVAPHSSPAVYNGAVYMGSDLAGTTLDAFSASTGTLLWRGGGALNGGGVFLSSPAVAGGVAYIASPDGNFYAYSTKTGSQCSGTPLNCKPLWTASIGGVGSVGQSSPTVVNGVVYVSAGASLYAFSASGSSTYCSGTPKTCVPEWTANFIDGQSSPAVYNGVVYVAGTTRYLDAFSTTPSSANCSGSPMVCQPLWSYGFGDNSVQSPAVANGVVYIPASNNLLYAFSTTEGSQCSGSPVTCQPLWSVSTDTSQFGGGEGSTPAVANGFIYVESTDGNLHVYSTSGSLLWTAPGAGFAASPAVANGVVYSSANYLYAFSAAGTMDCTGTSPNKTCSPLWSGGSNSGSGYASPAVADGVVYIAQYDGLPLAAFKLP